MKKLLLGLPITAALLLGACGETAVEKVEKSDAPAAAEKEQKETNTKEDKRTELGKVTDYYSNDKLNYSIKTGPMKLEFSKIMVYEIELKEQYKAQFKGADVINVIALKSKVENTSKDLVNFYPDQATIVTDTKEQIDASMIASDHIGGEFIGEVEKEGTVAFLLNKSVADVKKISINIDGPSNDSFDRVGEDIKAEFTLKK